MNKKIINEVEKKILNLCDSKDKKIKIWRNHIIHVVKYSSMLAKKLNADTEICELAAWLHDIAKIEGQRKKHHVLGSKRAREILKELKYDNKKIKIVEACILTHSSDKNYEPKTLEQKILASADAIAFFEDFLLFVYGLYIIKEKPAKEVKSILKEKVKEKWEKVCLLDEAKEISLPKYEAIKLLLK